MNSRLAIVALLAAGVMNNGATHAQRPAAPTVQVYKSPSCGCCAIWVEHLQKNGFATRVTSVEEMAGIKTKHNVPDRVESCHTATVDGYVIEGHVPATDIQRLLKERPAVAGLAVPGMPAGSPGMEVANMKAEAYRVFTFDKQGQFQVFASH